MPSLTGKVAPARVAKTGRIKAVRITLTAWLTRPLASFHLVLAVFGLLTALGLIMVLSASAVDSLRSAGDSYTVFVKQLIYAGFGLVLFWLVLRTSPRTLRRISLALVLVSLLLLILVLLVGQELNGAKSWFKVGTLSFQPVEPAKVAFALWGAHVLVTKRALLHQWRHLLVPVVPVALLMFALLMLQPDLGSTITLAIVLLALLWFAGAQLSVFAVLLLGAITGAVAMAVVEGYRFDRIIAFLNPEADPQGAAFQAKQALFALGEGGLTGVGLGQGSAKWKYLPNVHNDFIFAVIGQELGLIGCLMVLSLFGLLAYAGLRIAARNTDPWNQIVAASLTMWLVGQAAINVGYVIGLLPVTGLPLPLISSGGTSVVTTMVVFGILANCARHEPEAVAALRSLGPGRVGRLLRLPTPEVYRPPARRRPARPSTPPRKAGRPSTSTGRNATVRGTTGRGNATRGSTVHQLEERRRVRAEPRSRGSRRASPSRRELGGHR